MNQQKTVFKLETLKQPNERSSFGFCSGNGCVYVFGGYVCGSKNDSELWYINLLKDEFHWHQIKPKIMDGLDGYVWPSERCGGTLNYYKNSLYLYGGFNKKGCLNDLWRFDMNSKVNAWNKIISDVIPPYNCNHASVVYKDNIICFGGTYKQMYGHWGYHNDLFVYNITRNEWRLVDALDKPQHIHSHGMTITNNIIVIHGGLNDQYKSLNEMYYIDADDIINNRPSRWTEIRNSMFNALKGHTLISYKSRILCFGGVSGNAYAPFKLYSELIVHHNYNINIDIKTLLVYGYLKKMFNKYTPNIIVHRIAKYVNIPIFNEKLYPCPLISSREFHGGCVVTNCNGNDFVFIFGGYADQKYFNDSYLIAINKYDLR